ncbi:hypothetical protein SDB_04750 [Shigella dysenteriae CDC 74-1112]|nr:hypothetical protein SDB_04750 [Shigella dysenteriae CDC 74-1112]
MGTYVTNTGLMATYGGQFTLTLYVPVSMVVQQVFAQATAHSGA